jgi:hypothetical protein
MALALLEPVTPTGPMLSGWSPQVGPPCDAFDHGNIVGFGERCELGNRAGILHAAARDDHRALAA